MSFKNTKKDMNQVDSLIAYFLNQAEGKPCSEHYADMLEGYLAGRSSRLGKIEREIGMNFERELGEKMKGALFGTAAGVEFQEYYASYGSNVDLDKVFNHAIEQFIAAYLEEAHKDI
jgi:hypothetical protein